MNRAKNAIVGAFALLAVASCIRLCVGYWRYELKPIPASSRYMDTISPNGEYTVRAYYASDNQSGRTIKTLWCEYYQGNGRPEVFYIERNAEDNAKLRWVESDEIEISGLKLRLPFSFYKWERQEFN